MINSLIRNKSFLITDAFYLVRLEKMSEMILTNSTVEKIQIFKVESFIEDLNTPSNEKQEKYRNKIMEGIEHYYLTLEMFKSQCIDDGNNAKKISDFITKIIELENKNEIQRRNNYGR